MSAGIKGSARDGANGQYLLLRRRGAAKLIAYDARGLGRSAVATAKVLGRQAPVFPSHHGGFLGGELGYSGQPEAFAHRLRKVPDGD